MDSSIYGTKLAKLQMYDNDDTEIPTEDSTNWVTSFLTNTSKLITDKGNVKTSARLPLMKSLTSKIILIEPKFRFKNVKSCAKSNIPKKRNTTFAVKNFGNAISRLDSPEILKSIHRLKMSKEASSILRINEWIPEEEK